MVQRAIKGILAILVVMILIVGTVFAAEMIAVATKATPSPASTPSSTGSTSTSTSSHSSSSNSGSTSSDTRTSTATSVSSAGTSSASIQDDDSVEEGVKPVEREEDPVISTTNRFKEILKITDESKPKIQTVRKLLVRQQTNPNNFRRITEIVGKTINEDEKKELLVDELLDIDKRFIARYHNKLVKLQDTEEVEEEISDYISSVKEPETIKVEIKEEKITEVFAGKIDFDEFLEEIW